MKSITELLSDPLGLNMPSPVQQRQQHQWKVANDLLQPAATALAAGNTDLATATALVALLALKLSGS